MQLICFRQDRVSAVNSNRFQVVLPDGGSIALKRKIKIRKGIGRPRLVIKLFTLREVDRLPNQTNKSVG